MKCHTTLLKNSRKTLVKGEQNDDPYSKPVLCPIVISRFFLRCQCPQFLCSFRRQNSKTLNKIHVFLALKFKCMKKGQFLFTFLALCFWLENSNDFKHDLKILVSFYARKFKLFMTFEAL